MHIVRCPSCEKQNFVVTEETVFTFRCGWCLTTFATTLVDGVALSTPCVTPPPPVSKPVMALEIEVAAPKKTGKKTP